MDKKKISKPNWYLIFMGIMIIIMILSLPLMNLLFYDKFTYNFEKAINYYEMKQMQEKDCEWGTRCSGLGKCYCQSAPCKTYNIDFQNCVSEGYTGKGFLGLTDFNTEYYICKDYGKVALRCVDYWDSQKEMMDYYFNETNKNQTK